LLPLVSDIVRKPSAMQRADMQAKEVVGTTPASSKTVLTANRMKG
jgi:hypothetical protein